MTHTENFAIAIGSIPARGGLFGWFWRFVFTFAFPGEMFRSDLAIARYFKNHLARDIWDLVNCGYIGTIRTITCRRALRELNFTNL